MVDVSKATFEEEVLKAAGLVLVDFWAPWCGPCRMTGPVLEAIDSERDDVKICKVNVDDEGELAGEYGIMSIPALFFFKDGKKIGESIGFSPKEELSGVIDKLK